MAEDLETRWLRESGNSIGEFTNWCMDLADEVGQWLRRQGIKYLLVYIAPLVDKDLLFAHYQSGDRIWLFHAVLFAEGKIHDAWLGTAVTPSAYIADVFPDQKIRVEYIGENPNKDFEIMETWKNGRRTSVVRQ